MKMLQNVIIDLELLLKCDCCSYTSGSGFWSSSGCCSAAPGSEGVVGSELGVCSAGLGGSDTGLGGFAFSATRVPLDTSMKTSLWDWRNYARRENGKKQQLLVWEINWCKPKGRQIKENVKTIIKTKKWKIPFLWDHSVFWTFCSRMNQSYPWASVPAGPTGHFLMAPSEQEMNSTNLLLYGCTTDSKRNMYGPNSD